jgi:hypothetical protein
LNLERSSIGIISGDAIEKTSTIIRKKQLSNGVKMNTLNKLGRAEYQKGNNVTVEYSVFK